MKLIVLRSAFDCWTCCISRDKKFFISPENINKKELGFRFCLDETLKHSGRKECTCVLCVSKIPRSHSYVISFFQMPSKFKAFWGSCPLVMASGRGFHEGPASPLCSRMGMHHDLAIENAGYMSYSTHPCHLHEMQQRWNENWQCSVFTKVNYQKITKQTTFAQRTLTKACVSSTLQKVEFIF